MGIRFITTIILVVVPLWLTPVSALDSEPSHDVVLLAQYQVDIIRIHGLQRTRSHTVRRELGFEEGAIVSMKEIEVGVQYLRNTGLFHRVRWELVDERLASADGMAADEGSVKHRVLVLRLEERWTLLPSFGFNVSGGVLRISAALSDINLGGRYIEAGFGWSTYGRSHSFVAHLYQPRLFDQRLFLGAEVAHTNRVRFLYDDDGIQGGYHRSRFIGALTLQREWVRYFATALGSSFSHDTFSDELIPDSVEVLAPARGYWWDGWGSMRLGRVNLDSYLVDGQRLSLFGGVGISPSGHGSDAQTTLTAAGYRTLPFRSTIAARLAVGLTSSSHPDRVFFLGGFNAVRGLSDSRLRGQAFWYANAEARIPSIDTRWFVLQHVGFVDVATTSPSIPELGTVDAATYGAGVRFIIPVVYRFTGRIDYAFPIVGSAPFRWTLSAQQFF